METKILRLKCPNCSTSFLPTEAIWNELRSSIQTELTDEISAQHAELIQEKERVQKLSFKLSADREQLDNLVASKLKTKESELRTKIESQINSEKQEELELLESELLKKTKQLSDLNKTKREILLLQQQMEERETEIHLKYQEKLNSQLEEVKSTARTEATEENALAIKQKEKIISDLKFQLESARSKVDSYSGQLLGESQELLLEEMLRETFPQDRILEVPKGISGADSVLEINVLGTCVAKLLFESKNVKSSNFNKAWLKKLHEDNRSIGAQALVLVVSKLPKLLENERFGIIDGIHITTLSNVKSLVTLLRYSALKIAEVTKKHSGRTSKESMLFEFLTSTEFETLARSVLSQLDALKANFDLEKKRIVKLWSEREKMLELALLSTVEMYGKLRGITSEIPKIDSLEIPLDNAA